MNLLGAVPALPVHIPKVNQTAQWIFTLGQIPPIIVAIVLAVRWSREKRTLLPVMILLGGALMFLLLFFAARWATQTDPQILRILLTSPKLRAQYDPAKFSPISILRTSHV